MTLKSKFRTVMNSLIPGRYPALMATSFKGTVSYFFFVILFSLIIMTLLLIPAIFLGGEQLEKEFSVFQTFSIDLEVNQSAPFIITDQPLIILDQTRTGLEDEAVLITEDYVFYKPWLVLGEKTILLDAYKELTANTDKVSGLFVFFMLALIPALIVFVFLLFTLKAILFILFASLLGYFIVRLFKYETKWLKALKVAIFAATPMIFIDMALFPFYRLFWLPLALFLIFFILGMWMVSERRFALKTSKKEKHKV